MVQPIEQLPVLFAGKVNGGLAESVNLLLTRVVLWSLVLPTEELQSRHSPRFCW